MLPTQFADNQPQVFSNFTLVLKASLADAKEFLVATRPDIEELSDVDLNQDEGAAPALRQQQPDEADKWLKEGEISIIGAKVTPHGTAK